MRYDYTKFELKRTHRVIFKVAIGALIAASFISVWYIVLDIINELY